MHRWFGIALLAFSPALLAQSSQTPQPRTPQPQTPTTTQSTLHVSTSRVLLDFVVRNKHGQIVRNLKPSEVHVYENGVLQPIRHFEFINGKTEPSEVLTTTTATPEAATAASSSQSPSLNAINNLSGKNVVTIVVTKLHPRGRLITQKAMQAFVQHDLTTNTYVGVLGLGVAGLQTILPYTNNGEKIAKAVQEVTSSAFLSEDTRVIASDKHGHGHQLLLGNPGGFSDYELSKIEANPQLSPSDLYAWSVNFLSPLRSLIEEQRQIPGRKVVVLFSPGLPVAPDTIDLFDSLISAANRANVSFYTYDTKGMHGLDSGGRPNSELKISIQVLKFAAGQNRKQQLAYSKGGDQEVTRAEATALDTATEAIFADQRGTLWDLAEATGGQPLSSSLNIIAALRKVMQGVREHYEIAYSPTDSAIDGTFRHVQIKISRPGVTVFGPVGYFAVPYLNGHSIYPFEMATLKALHTRPAPHQVAFHAAVLRFHPGATQDQLAFVFQAPTTDLTIRKYRHALRLHVSVTTLIKNAQGKIVQKISKDMPYTEPLANKAALKKQLISFTAPFFLAPGHYSVETAVVDNESGKASVHRWTLDVPPADGFAMSDVSLVRRVDPIHGHANPIDPLEAHGGKVTPQLFNELPKAPGAKVTLYAVAYPQSSANAPVMASVQLDRDGKPVMKSPFSPVPVNAQGSASILASLPLSKLQPGHYQAKVTFQCKGQTLTKKTAFILHKHS